MLSKGTGARFSKVPATFRVRKAVFMFAVFAFKVKISIIFKNDRMKLSVNEAKLTGLCARDRATIQQVLILKFAIRPEKSLGLSIDGPLAGYILEDLVSFDVRCVNAWRDF